LAQELLSEFLGDVMIVEKGRQDLIHGHSHKKVDYVARTCESRMCSISTSNESGLKRCGGQGDILSGCIATFFSWGNAVYPVGNSLLWVDETTHEAVGWSSIACYAACYLTRDASRRAFSKHGRSVVCTDIIEEIGPAFSDVFSDHQ
jgi:ATP-dependent NAD(P)H-hydrate dehydratase